MSDSGGELSGGHIFEIRRGVNDQKFIYRTDSEIDFIRQSVQDRIESYDLQGRVIPKIEAVEDGWTIVALAYAPDLDDSEWPIASDFEQEFGEAATSYLTREGGSTNNGSLVWYYVKHIQGLGI